MLNFSNRPVLVALFVFSLSFGCLESAVEIAEDIDNEATSQLAGGKADWGRDICSGNCSRFAFAGDIMMGSDYKSSALPPENGKHLFDDVKPYLNTVDLGLGNLEGPLTKSNSCTKSTSSGNSYAFRMPPAMASNLVEAGFDVVNTANNHANDFGEAGKTETISTLDNEGIGHTGFTNDIFYTAVNGLKVAVIGFSHSPGSNDLRDIETAKALVTEADSKADLVLVTFHGGKEGSGALHVSNKTETFYGENRGNVVKFAHACIDAGADIVVGHGPHVPRAVELYKGRFIAYSLGNFCTWNGISVSGYGGLAPLLIVGTDNSGQFLGARIVSFSQRQTHYPKLDESGEAYQVIQELTETDFPETELDFSADGLVSPINPD